MVLSSPCPSACVRRHRPPPTATAAAAAVAPDLLVRAAAMPPPIDLWPRLELTRCALPRSTLPRPDGFFGRLSTLAAGFGLPALRFGRLAGLADGGWPVDAGSCRRGGCRRRVSWPALFAAWPPWPFSPSSVLLRMSRVPGGPCARPPVGDLVALLDVLGAVANGVVGVRD